VCLGGLAAEAAERRRRLADVEAAQQGQSSGSAAG
jgi:hypothetical protein